MYLARPSVALEVVSSSKHQTESSADRQLPVGDVYSRKLPCAIVTSVAMLTSNRKSRQQEQDSKVEDLTSSSLNFNISIKHAKNCLAFLLQV